MIALAAPCATAITAKKAKIGKNGTSVSHAFRRASAEGAKMALATLKTNPQRGSTSHRRYRDPTGTQMVACVAVTEVQLAALAATADQIELRQPVGGGWVPDDFVDRITNGLRALPLLIGSRIANGDVALRRVRQLVCDGLARMRVRYGRHVLAGEFQRTIEGKPHRILVLVLAQRQVISCDWYIT